jgi:hypothetical protein
VLWTAPLDSQESVPESAAGFDRIHARRSMSTSLSWRVNISTLPSLGKETSLRMSDPARSWQRLGPTAWEMRTSGPRPGRSYPPEHQSPGPTLREIHRQQKKGLSMAMSINDVDTRINS